MGVIYLQLFHLCIQMCVKRTGVPAVFCVYILPLHLLHELGYFSQKKHQWKLFRKRQGKLRTSSQYNSCTTTTISTGHFILTCNSYCLCFVGFTQPCLLIRPENLMPELNYMPSKQSVQPLPKIIYFFGWEISITFAFHSCIH